MKPIELTREGFIEMVAKFKVEKTNIPGFDLLLVYGLTEEELRELIRLAGLVCGVVLERKE